MRSLMTCRLKAHAGRLKRTEDSIGELLRRSATDQDSLIGEVLADAQHNPGMDPESELTGRILSRRLGCPERSLGLVGVGILGLVRARPADGAAIIGQIGRA